MSKNINLAKRNSIIDLSSYIDKKIRIKFVGGREIVGILKGADPVCNLVLDEAEELERDKDNSSVVIDYILNLYKFVL